MTIDLPAQVWDIGGKVQIVTSDMSPAGPGNGNGLDNVNVNYIGSPALPAGSCTAVTTTGGGAYSCTASVSPLQFITITPSVTSTAFTNTCGVDMTDMCWMQTYVLFAIGGTSVPGCANSMSLPHWSGLVAADVDQSGRVTGADVVEVRRMILGQAGGPNPPPSYYFYPQAIDAAKQFEYTTALTYPFIYYPESILATGPGQANNFYAVKVGDPISTCTSTVAIDGSGALETYGAYGETDQTVRMVATADQHQVVLRPYAHDAHMLSFVLELGEYASALRGISSNLSLDIEGAYALEGSHLRVIVLSDQIEVSPEVRLIFETGTDLEGVAFDLVSDPEIPNKIWTSREISTITLSSSQAIDRSSAVLVLNSRAELRAAFGGQDIEIYTTTGMQVHHGSIDGLASLAGGIYIVTRAGMPAQRFVYRP